MQEPNHARYLMVLSNQQYGRIERIRRDVDSVQRANALFRLTPKGWDLLLYRGPHCLVGKFPASLSLLARAGQPSRAMAE